MGAQYNVNLMNYWTVQAPCALHLVHLLEILYVVIVRPCNAADST